MVEVPIKLRVRDSGLVRAVDDTPVSAVPLGTPVVVVSSKQHAYDSSALEGRICDLAPEDASGFTCGMPVVVWEESYTPVQYYRISDTL